MRHFLTFLLVFQMAWLMGCQSKKKINCSKVNWRLEGEKAATLGKIEKESLKELEGLCKAKDKLIDEKAYHFGYKDGLKMFCTTQMGLSMGSSGQVYKNTCPKKRESTFIKGYINGRITYLQEQVNSNSSEYANTKDRFWRKEQEYLLLKNEDPEQAKMQRDFLEAYQEESTQLEKGLEKLKKELTYLKRRKEEMKFN